MAGIKPKGPVSEAAPMAAALEQYTPRLHQYLLRLLHDPREIPDIVQETFKRFLSRAERPEVVRDPLAFLLGMARNVARELFYEEQHRRVTFDSDLLAIHSSDRDAAADECGAEELAVQEDIARALGQLPEAHFAVLMLVEGEGRSYEEAAQITGFTRSTVATYLMQARARLRTLLNDQRNERDITR